MKRVSLKSVSKFLSLVLRHDPGVIGVELDSEGWLSVDALVKNANAQGTQISKEMVYQIVEECEKQRFELSENDLWIRANQGHSIRTVDLGLTPIQPPTVLFHGTVKIFIEKIRTHGLAKKARNHVHLSKDRPTAIAVGSRRGKPIILEIESHRMYQDGFAFYLSKNGVWLTELVPVEYINFP